VPDFPTNYKLHTRNRVHVHTSWTPLTLLCVCADFDLPGAWIPPGHLSLSCVCADSDLSGLGHLLDTPHSPVCVQILTYTGLGHLLDTPHSPVCAYSDLPRAGIAARHPSLSSVCADSDLPGVGTPPGHPSLFCVCVQILT
jgi:hypothetical protein